MTHLRERLQRRGESLMADPPGPFRRTAWRSPLRGPWLTAVLGLTLLAGLTVVIVTGLLSYAAYDPRLGTNDPTPHTGLLGFYLFDWPTRPVWLYRVTQGAHVVLGVTLIPVILAKLWSVIPKLFVLPPVKNPAQAVERLSLLLLVGGIIFETVTGVLNIQLDYVFGFSFYTAHLYGAWVFLSAFVVHTAVKLPVAIRAVRARRAADGPSGTEPGTEPGTEEEPDGEPDDLTAVAPGPPTLSRRGALAFVGGGSLVLFGATLGQTIDGPLRRTGLLAPHGRTYGSGPNDFQVNKTARFMGITQQMTGEGWRLELRGARTASLSRADLLAMEQHTHRLPIACVEGWSTDQEWTGVPLRTLAALVGSDPVEAEVRSLQKSGMFARVTLSTGQVANPRSMLALRVNGADLSPDHGYPARTMVPAAPGVHNTKWIARITFRAPASTAHAAGKQDPT